MGDKNGVDWLNVSKESMNSESIEIRNFIYDTSMLQAFRSLFEK